MVISMNRFVSESQYFISKGMQYDHRNQKFSNENWTVSISVTSWTLKARHLEAIFFQSVIDKIPGILTNEPLPRPCLKAYYVERLLAGSE